MSRRKSRPSTLPVLPKPRLLHLQSILRRSARDGGHYQDAIALAELVVIAAEKTDVFLVDVNIHEAANLPGLVAKMFADRREALFNFAEKFGKRCRAAFDCLNSVGKAAKRRGYLNSDFHLLS